MIINTNSQDGSWQLLDDARAAGIQSFDTAWVYGGGNSERCLGPWVNDRGIREEVVVVSKGCHHNADRKRVTPYDLTADLMDSLARLQFDYVDGYLCHRDDPDVPAGEIVDCFNEHRDAGRLRAFGGSNWTHQRIAEANEYAARNGKQGFTLSSPNFGLAEQVENPWGPGCVSLSGPQNREARAWYAEQGIAVLAYSSLGRGLFSGRVTRQNYEEVADGACQRAYCHEVNFRRLDRARELAGEKGVNVAQIAMAWVLNQPLNVFALAGAASKEECEQLAVAAAMELTPAEREWLDLQRDDR
jgi:aryl-alcohol dehydrogenase-like predicted oxidoreductase